jgi:chromatin segregation and condensation protein Rec8/ScpA/Scc1 (kleisin family)
VRSLKRRLTVVPRPATVVRQRRVVSLREVIERVSHLLRRERSLRFSEVVAPLVSRTDVATAFLAVLVLVRREAVVAEQGDLFSEIHLGQGTAGTTLETPIDEFVN